MAKANGKPAAERENQAKTEHQPERPVHEVRIGRIKAAIWANEGDNGTWFNVTVSRSYKDGDEWKSSSSFGRDELLTLAKVADLGEVVNDEVERWVAFFRGLAAAFHFVGERDNSSASPAGRDDFDRVADGGGDFTPHAGDVRLGSRAVENGEARCRIAMLSVERDDGVGEHAGGHLFVLADDRLAQLVANAVVGLFATSHAGDVVRLRLGLNAHEMSFLEGVSLSLDILEVISQPLFVAARRGSLRLRSDRVP